MEHIVDFVCCAPMVQILDAPVPQTVAQLPHIFHFFDTLTTDPEQVRTSLCERSFVNRSWWNSWWKCRLSCLLPCRSTRRRKTLSWRWPAMPLAARGSRYLDRAVIAGGGCRVRAPPSGTTRKDTPPGQGGKEILASDDVDVPSIMQLVFQQSKSYVFFAAIQFPRQSAGHSSCATEGIFHSAVLEQGCCR